MNILAIDTSTAYCSVTVFIGKDQSFSETKYLPRKHNEYILLMIDELIIQSRIQKHEINLLAYGVGPGSFVGVRISAAVMQAMALSLDCPIIGFSSMQAIAMTAYHQFKATSVSVIIDARMSEIYFGQYHWNENFQTMVFEEELCLKIVKCKEYILQRNLGFIIGDVIKGIDLKFNAIKYYPNTQLLLSLIKYQYDQSKQNNMFHDIVQPVYLQGTSQWKKLQ